MDANYMFVNNEMYQSHASTVYSSSNRYHAWRAFSRDHGWISKHDGDFTPQWLEFRFPSNRKVQSYSITAQGWGLEDRSPRAWKLQGYNGSSWVTIDSRRNYDITFWQQKTERDFTIPTTANYSRYRLYIEQTNGSPVTSIIRFKLYSMQAESSKKSSTSEENSFIGINQEEFLPETDFTISPNPSSGTFKVKFDKRRINLSNNLPDTPKVEQAIPMEYLNKKQNELEIYTISGKLIKKVVQNEQEKEYNLGLKPGVYFIKCNTNGNRISKKFIVK